MYPSVNVSSADSSQKHGRTLNKRIKEQLESTRCLRFYRYQFNHLWFTDYKS